ncbi:hypothetical protein EMCRGX_G017335 [Ephydatia muelleri]
MFAWTHDSSDVIVSGAVYSLGIRPVLISDLSIHIKMPNAFPPGDCGQLQERPVSLGLDRLKLYQIKESRERMSYGNAPGGAQAQGGKVGVLRNQVDEVKGVMRQNIEKVMQREEKLQDLGERAEILSHDANNFQRSAVKVRNKLWWQNKKLWIILISIIVLIILLVVGAIAIPLGIKYGKKS